MSRGWTVAQIAAQIADDLHAALVMPAAGLLGVDLEQVLRGRVEQAAPRLAAELVGEDTGHRVATDILTTMWGTTGDPEPGWWRTPLGRACARATADESTESITHQAAANMLGVHRGTISQMVARGTLERHPDGGVLRASVLQRLGR